MKNITEARLNHALREAKKGNTKPLESIIDEAKWVQHRKKEMFKKLRPQLLEVIKKVPDNFKGALSLKLYKKGLRSIDVLSSTILPHFTRDVMIELYRKYSGFYEEKRLEFMDKRKSEYGADKYAVDETAKAILAAEGMDVNKTNLKQAMTRLFTRRPIRRMHREKGN